MLVGCTPDFLHASDLLLGSFLEGLQLALAALVLFELAFNAEDCVMVFTDNLILAFVTAEFETLQL